MLIEFALSSSLLFLLLFGVIDFSRVFAIACAVQGAARSGTQYGMLSPAHYNDFNGMRNAAVGSTNVSSGLTASAYQFCSCSIGGARVDCPATCSAGSPETYIEVDVAMPYYTIASYPGIPAITNLSARSIVRVQ